MINIERTIFIQETEIRPNTYARIVLFCTIGITLICLALNEIGLFRVDKMIMRIGTVISLTTTGIPLLYTYIRRNALSIPSTKYIIMFASISFTAVTSIMLTFHTTIMLLFPIFIAMLYRSQLMGKIAIYGSLACTFASSLVAYILGTWDVPLFEELILIATNGTTVIEGAHAGITLESILKILLYLTFPKMMMVGSCAVILRSVIKLGVDHVDTQIQLIKQSKRDVLTGLYNQNYYKEMVNSGRYSGRIAIIFFDVNGLKDLNDKKGHEQGDLLLQRCAQSILNVATDDRMSCFRVGGDEFIVFIEDATDNDVIKLLEKWNASIKAINEENELLYSGLRCSMAVGYAVGDFENLTELISKADSQMYKNKSLLKAGMKTFAGFIDEA